MKEVTSQFRISRVMMWWWGRVWVGGVVCNSPSLGQRQRGSCEKKSFTQTSWCPQSQDFSAVFSLNPWGSVALSIDIERERNERKREEHCSGDSAYSRSKLALGKDDDLEWGTTWFIPPRVSLAGQFSAVYAHEGYDLFKFVGKFLFPSLVVLIKGSKNLEKKRKKW